MTDLSAGEHIIDALEIELRKANRIPDMLLQGHTMRQTGVEVDQRFFPPTIPARDSRYALPRPESMQMTVTGELAPEAALYFGSINSSKWMLNGKPLSISDPATLHRLSLKLASVVEKLPMVTRHPSSERFHSLLPTVAEMAYRLDHELDPTGAQVWGIDSWIVPMRNLERALRSLQAVARGDRIAQNPMTLMMEIAALSLVAKRYHAGETSSTWAHDYVAEMGATHDKKMQDYGRDTDPFSNVRASEDWSVDPWVGAMIRLTDKVRRLQAFAVKGVLANESALDSLGDIPVYSVIARVLYEQQHD